MGAHSRILLVEDDRRLAALIAEYLEQHGFQVAIEPRGDTAVARIVAEQPDLVILDLMLPGMDGFAVCREARPRFPGPVLILTARDEAIDQVVGLELGADDYVTKPVEPRVLVARIRALFRRFQASPETAVPHGEDGEHFGRLEIAPRAREVRVDGTVVGVGSNEFEVLCLLARRAGEIVSRDDILSQVRGIGYDGLDRSVDIAVSRLRRKLDADGGHAGIKTVRGRGYLFDPGYWSP